MDKFDRIFQLHNVLNGRFNDAWEDDRDALRSFSTDRILRATMLDDPALDIPEAEMDEHHATDSRLEDGSHELQIPYREPRELVMDILRHGAGVEVLAPKELRSAVEAELLSALDTYHLVGGRESARNPIASI